MKVYCISYNLKKAGESYKNLYDEIKNCGEWWRYLESTWLVSSELEVNEIAERLAKHIDLSSDNFLVMEITDNYEGWMPKSSWLWINERFDEINKKK